VEPDHDRESGAGSGQFQDQVAAEAVTDSGELRGVRARLCEKDVQASAGQSAGALRVMPQLVKPGNHGFPVGHGLATALIVECKRDVAQLGELIRSGTLVVNKPRAFVSDENRGMSALASR
jgi:hypothetical protein